jgi:hypothetical protein
MSFMRLHASSTVREVSVEQLHNKKNIYNNE